MNENVLSRLMGADPSLMGAPASGGPALAQLMGAFPQDQEGRLRLRQAMQRDKRVGYPLQGMQMDEAQGTGDLVRPGVFSAQQDAEIARAGNMTNAEGRGAMARSPWDFFGGRFLPNWLGGGMGPGTSY